MRTWGASGSSMEWMILELSCRRWIRGVWPTVEQLLAMAVQIRVVRVLSIIWIWWRAQASMFTIVHAFLAIVVIGNATTALGTQLLSTTIE